VGPDSPRRLRVPGLKRVSEVSNGFRVEASGDARAAVARVIVEAGGELTSIEAGHASLEEVYTRYFEGCAMRRDGYALAGAAW